MRHRLARLPRVGSIGVVVAVLTLLIVGRHVTPGVDDRRRFDHRLATVRSVIDGNTLDVLVDDSAVRVRLLGIDASPSAAAYLAARAGGRRVTLRLDELAATRTDAGELLAYVFLDDTELLNQSMIRDGVAYANRVGDCDLLPQFEGEENGARAARRGFWKTITADQMPAWRRAWMRERHLD